MPPTHKQLKPFRQRTSAYGSELKLQLLALLVPTCNLAASALSIISDCARDVGTEKTALFSPVRYRTSAPAFRASSAATKRATSSGAPSTSTVCVEDEEHPASTSATNATVNDFMVLNAPLPAADHSRPVRVCNGSSLDLRIWRAWGRRTRALNDY